MAEAGTNDCATQKDKIKSLITKQLKGGDTWYLVESHWFKQWKKYVGYDSWDTGFVGDKTAHPGPIDNSLLLQDGSGHLKENLIDELDYFLVPQEAWDLLTETYSTVEGQTPISRKVIEQGMFVKHCKVEVYLMDLKLSRNSQLENAVTKQFSRADTIEHIASVMRQEFHIAEDTEVRLWNKYMSNTYEPLTKPDNTIQDAGLYQGQVIVIEERAQDGTWPRQMPKSSTVSSATSSQQTQSNGVSKDEGEEPISNNKWNGNSGSSTSYGGSGGSRYTYGGSYDSGYGSKAGKRGLCGLSNLGNTCFMNSALQCMSNVRELTEYFLSDKWQSELNKDNPLGMHGQIATTYAELIHTIWSGKYSYTVPRNFKVAVGRFAPQFSGYQQQDSQELMAFLLDGLHEDLNRIRKKPYVEIKDANGRPDQEVAKEAWENYLKRNDSVIVDTFHGLLKSTLVCPECDKVSVTFDPFCYLSLPLPMKTERHIEVFYVPLKPERKTRNFKLTVPKHGHVKDLCKALAKKVEVNFKQLVVTDVYNHKFHKVYSSNDHLSNIMDRDDIFMYEIPVEGADDPETLILPVYSREMRQVTSGYQHSTYHLFGTPLLVPVPRGNCDYKTLYNCVLDRMSRYVTVPKSSDDWLKRADSQNSEEEQMENSDSSDELGDKADSDEEIEPFTFHMVNSYGSTEVEAIRNDDKPIKFSGRSYVAMDWHPMAKARYYDEKKAEALEMDDSVKTGTPSKRSTVQLSDCLDLFTSQEQLGEQDPWYCPQCKQFRQAYKKFDLWQLPQVLVVHLKRFSYNRFWRDKLDTFVEYPVNGLDMRHYILNTAHLGSTVYDLISVSNHYGGMGGGHYTAYGKNCEDSQWYYFDDSSVSEANQDSPVTKAGYVLVYRRRDPGYKPPEQETEETMDIEQNH